MMARKVMRKYLLPGDYLKKMVDAEPVWDDHSQSWKDLHLLDKELDNYKRDLIRAEHIQKNKDDAYVMREDSEIDEDVRKYKDNLIRESKIWNMYNNPPGKITKYTQMGDQLFGIPGDEWYHEGAYFKKKPKYMVDTGQKSFRAYAPLSLQHKANDFIRRGAHRSPEGILFFINLARNRPEFSMYVAYIFGFAYKKDSDKYAKDSEKYIFKDPKEDSQDQFIHFIRDYIDAERRDNKDVYDEYNKKLTKFKEIQAVSLSQPHKKSKEQSNPHQLNIVDESLIPERRNLSRYTYRNEEVTGDDQYDPARRRKVKKVLATRKPAKKVLRKKSSNKKILVKKPMKKVLVKKLVQKKPVKKCTCKSKKIIRRRV